MKILHIVRALTKHNGVAVFAAEAASAQASQGQDVTMLIHWLNEYPPSEAVKLIENKRTLRALRGLPRPDIVHIHAFWKLDAVLAMMWCKLNNVPYVVSPHGGLMPRVFTKGRVKKWLVYHGLLKPLINGAQAIHCTGDGEVAAVKALGLKPKTFVVPLGCHLPVVDKLKCEVEVEERMVLFLGRLGEEKGLELLLDAWKQIKNEGWRLVIAGPSWLCYGEKLKAKVETEGIVGVEFPGSADEAMKDKLYREADLFILSSPMENFSMVVLDALAYGVPVVCTKGTPWKCIDEAKCGWWVDYSLESFKNALREAMSLDPDQLEEMGARARGVAEKFSWPTIGRELVTTYWGLL